MFSSIGASQNLEIEGGNPLYPQWQNLSTKHNAASSFRRAIRQLQCSDLTKTTTWHKQI